METPLERVPPRLTSVAPLGAGSGLAGCGGGGVGAIGAAGSTFRLLENICIFGKSPSRGAWDSYSQRSNVCAAAAPASRGKIDDGAAEAEERRADKVRSRAELPKPRSKDGAGADQQVTDKIVS